MRVLPGDSLSKHHWCFDQNSVACSYVGVTLGSACLQLDRRLSCGAGGAHAAEGRRKLKQPPWDQWTGNRRKEVDDRSCSGVGMAGGVERTAVYPTGPCIEAVMIREGFGPYLLASSLTLRYHRLHAMRRREDMSQAIGFLLSTSAIVNQSPSHPDRWASRKPAQHVSNPPKPAI